MYRILLLVGALCLSPWAGQAQLFRTDPLDLPPTVARVLAVELTQDEWVDYFLYGADPPGNPGSWAYENQGDGTFVLRPLPITPLTEATFAFADFNRDNQVDVLVSGRSANGPVTELYYNQSGDLAGPPVPIAPVRAHSLTCADFDQDGRIDILLNGHTATDSAVALAYRNTNAGFVEVTTSVAPTVAGENLAYEWDNDGRIDLLQAGTLPSGETVTRVHRNRGGFVFDTLAVSLGLPAVVATALATGDVNHDGRADLLLTGTNARNEPVAHLYVYQDSSYVEAGPELPSVVGTLATLADFDHNGRTDLSLVGADAAGQSVARWFLQDSSGWIAQSYDSLAALDARWAIGDVDNDGHLDVLRSGSAMQPSLLLLNQTEGVNAGPAAPFGPLVSAIDTVTVFRWLPATDDQTSASAFTYELYVLPEGNNQYAVSPEYRDTTKARVDHGRVGYPGQYALNGLPEGTYSWSVAGVDNSFQIGPSCEGEGGRPLCFTLVREDTTACTGTSLNLSTPVPVAWSSSLAGPLGQSTELVHVVRGNEVLYYTALSGDGCDLTYSLRIQTLPTSNADLLAADTTVCPGALLTLAVDAAYDTVTWFSASQGVLGGGDQLVWEARQEDTLWVQAQVRGEDCPMRDTLVVSWFPSVNLLAAEELSLTAGASVTVAATGAVAYRWSPATGLSSINTANPVASPSRTTTYVVEGTTANGCVARDTITLLVSESPPPAVALFVPNLFSPNGDGQNDTFRLYGQNISAVAWQVYDRQGTLLFEANDLDAGWNGQHRGRPVPNGVYLWKLSGEDADGRPLEFEGQQSGMVRLVR